MLLQFVIPFSDVLGMCIAVAVLLQIMAEAQEEWRTGDFQSLFVVLTD